MQLSFCWHWCLSFQKVQLSEIQMGHQEAATVWPFKLYLPTLAKAGLVIKRAVSKSSHHPGLETQSSHVLFV